MDNIGKKISEVRRSRELSQGSIAQRLGRTPQWLSNIELGKRSISARELGAIAAILGVDVNIFFEDELDGTSKRSA